MAARPKVRAVHPVVRDIAHEKQIAHTEAEDLLRTRAARDQSAKAIIDQIDRDRAAEKEAALSLNQEMSQRLGMTLELVGQLAGKIAADPELETWLLRRVYLTRAHEAPPADDFHPVNI